MPSPLIPIDSLDDPRVAPYRNLKDKVLDREGRRFIAEGENVVRRLLASDYPVESVFCMDHRVAAVAEAVPAGVPLYVGSGELMEQVIGFDFHTGVVACGRRKPPATLDDVLPKGKPDLFVVVCGDVANAENLGSLVRLSAGFGADAMLLGERCHDPFWRQCVRVSMGTIFKLPIVKSRDLPADLRRLRAEWGVEVAATVLDPDAESIATAGRPGKFALAFGNEAHGLSPEQVAACDRRVTIPMGLGTDSLNVAVAAGIFLYHFTQVAPAARAIRSQRLSTAPR
jgi:tRNA G18 (ribose-2'-O)-methylase SpoU